MAPDTEGFCGRDRLLTELQERIELDRCRLVLLLGIAGIGKTQLATRLAQQMQDQFEVVIWRSLNRELTLTTLLNDLLQTLHHLLPNPAPQTSEPMTSLWGYLSRHRCLIVLDGIELVLRSGAKQQDGLDCDAYAAFLRRLGEVYHTSCLVLTSRERPYAITTLSGRSDNVPVYYCWLEELGEEAAREMLANKFALSGSDRDWSLFIHLYTGNPFALNVAASKIQDLYEGQIFQFLEVHATETAIFGEIRKVFDQQFARLSNAELAILNWLAQVGEPVPRTKILAEITPAFSNEQLDQGLQALMWRSLLTLENAYYSLHPLVQEYAQERLKHPT
jgi:predicted ATPase